VPASADIRQAAALLLEIFTDFPFVDEASRAHALGLVVLAFTRDLVDGRTPLHALDAPMPGSGKGLLADAVAHLATGRPIEVMSEAKDDEEQRKRITGLLLSGRAFGLVDNITRRLDSGPLAAVLTADTWSDRLLGVSRVVELQNRTTWIVTGNNLTFSREMGRRTVWCRLDARHAEPHRVGISATRSCAGGFLPSVLI
jgi:hypothetical protein